MQRDVTDSWNKICQCATQTATDVAELNINLMNRISRGTAGSLNESPKKPEDLFKVINTTNLELMKYTQDLFEIYLENSQQVSKLLTDLMRETQANASKVVRGVAKIKEREV